MFFLVVNASQGLYVYMHGAILPFLSLDHSLSQSFKLFSDIPFLKSPFVVHKENPFMFHVGSNLNTETDLTVADLGFC